MLCREDAWELHTAIHQYHQVSAADHGLPCQEPSVTVFKDDVRREGGREEGREEVGREGGGGEGGREGGGREGICANHFPPLKGIHQVFIFLPVQTRSTMCV